MGEAKFTPGLWHAAGNVVRDEHDHDLFEAALTFEWEPGFGLRPIETVKADMRLAAAAPELLAALVEARAWIPTGERNSTPEKRGAKCDFASDVDALIEAAIRKATEPAEEVRVG